MIKIFFSEKSFQKEVDSRCLFLTEEISRLNKMIDDLVQQLLSNKHKKTSNYIKNKVTKKKK
jgi:hypothetical protein